MISTLQKLEMVKLDISGTSQAELSTKFGVSKQAISQFMNSAETKHLRNVILEQVAKNIASELTAPPGKEI